MPPQEILTKDSVTVSVDAVVYYQVSQEGVRKREREKKVLKK